VDAQACQQQPHGRRQSQADAVGTGTNIKLQRFLNLRYWSSGGET
jgi:hypothetical protein